MFDKPIFETTKSLAGDRFISSRDCSKELYTNFEKKSEIFTRNAYVTSQDKLGNTYDSPIENEDPEANLN